MSCDTVSKGFGRSKNLPNTVLLNNNYLGKVGHGLTMGTRSLKALPVYSSK